MKTAFFSGLLLASVIPPLAGLQEPGLTTTECENVHQHEPLLVYEISGSTLSGQIDQTLVVFSDGSLKLSTAAPEESGTCVTAKTTPAVAADLFNALANAGALSLCDDSMLVIDMPLHTVTLLRGAHDVRGRTFSFWDTQGAYGVVDSVLEDFIEKQFPDS